MNDSEIIPAALVAAYITERVELFDIWASGASKSEVEQERARFDAEMLRRRKESALSAMGEVIAQAEKGLARLREREARLAGLDYLPPDVWGDEDVIDYVRGLEEEGE